MENSLNQLLQTKSINASLVDLLKKKKHNIVSNL